MHMARTGERHGVFLDNIHCHNTYRHRGGCVDDSGDRSQHSQAQVIAIFFSGASLIVGLIEQNSLNIGYHAYIT